MLSRTDSIGDVVLTLPMAGFIKKMQPTAKVIFLGRSYTKEVIELSEHVDVFLNYDDLANLSLHEQQSVLSPYHISHFVHVFPNKAIAKMAKGLGIKNRIGTSHRWYHWFTCNKLISLSRKKSNLHESQLNLQLLLFMGVNTRVELKDMHGFYGFTKLKALQFEALKWIDPSKTNLILHPKSKGSAKEWGLENFSKLIRLLPKDKYQVFISGTADDAKIMHDFLNQEKEVINITGQLSLKEFIVFINACDALIAASTGPLHIAAALNKKSIGLFSSKRPMHPGRWAPVGLKAKALVYDEQCETCLAGKECNCIEKIEPSNVLNLLNESF